MFKRRVSTISRDSLSKSYVLLMSRMLHRLRGVPIPEAEAFVTNIVKTKLVIPKVRIIETVRPGVTKVKVYPLTKIIQMFNGRVVTPSGSVFESVNKIRSIISVLSAEFMSERKIVKGKQFKALREGFGALAGVYQSVQNSIKVTLNSIAGGYGYAGCLLYDKGCYNATTSSGRLLISTAFVICEELLGGNPPIYTKEEAINLVLLGQEYGPSDEQIAKVMNNHKLKWVSVEDVAKYMADIVVEYNYSTDLTTDTEFITLLKTLTPERLQFLYYNSNLQHVCFTNSDYFRNKLLNALSIEGLVTENIEFSADTAYSLDGDIMSIALTLLSTQSAGRDLPTIIKESANDGPDSEATLLGKQLIASHARITALFENISDIFEVFMYHDIIYPQLMKRNEMQRRSVVVSDTDSVIFTMRQWSEWYTQQDQQVIEGSYHIAAVCIYWLTVVNGDAMAKFSISSGAVNEDIGLLQMKSEFLYLAMMLYEAKKMYAALTAAQEGVVFKEPVPDIKGQPLRGAQTSPSARQFNNELLVEDILKPVIKQELDARVIIDKVLAFEKKIQGSLHEGSLEYLPLVSVGMKKDYADPIKSVFFKALAWNEIFGPKYGEINVPAKPPYLVIIKPTPAYFEWLRGVDKGICDRFENFIDKYGKPPGGIFIEPLQGKLPEELMPLINVRHITYSNISPNYLSLEGLNLGCGHSKKKLLLSDLYE